jgi:hypothetical protein
MVRVLELRKNNPGGFRELGKVDKTDVMRLAFCKNIRCNPQTGAKAQAAKYDWCAKVQL